LVKSIGKDLSVPAGVETCSHVGVFEKIPVMAVF